MVDAQDQVLEVIKNTLTAHGIDLPFPTQQILLQDQTEATADNRRTQREGWLAGQAAVPKSRAEVQQEQQATTAAAPQPQAEKSTD